MSHPGRPLGSPRVPVLLAAAAAPWEQDVLRELAAPGPVALARRCLDLGDLLAAATAGTASVAVCAEQLPGLDRDAVTRLRSAGLAVVVVADGSMPADDETPASRAQRWRRVGASRVLHDPALLVPTVVEAAEAETDAAQDEGGRTAVGTEAAGGPSTEPSARSTRVNGVGGVGSEEPTAGGAVRGKVVAVWGPTGAPGRTTVAMALAGHAARLGRHVCLVDADPDGGAVATALAMVDEVSGVLAAARLANTGRLQRERLAALAREVEPRLRVVTGLPRPDRWRELRPGAVEELLETAADLDDLVVVDAGSRLPEEAADPFGSPTREDVTQVVVRGSDAVVAVGAADPVGLTRLAAGLELLTACRPSGPDVVVVNRVRPTLGWADDEVLALLDRLAPGVPVVLLGEDRAAVDSALVRGATPGGAGALAAGVEALAARVAGVGEPPRAGRLGRVVRRSVRRLRRSRRGPGRQGGPAEGRAGRGGQVPAQTVSSR